MVIGIGKVSWYMVHSPDVRYGESKHCADQEAVKLAGVRAVKGSKGENRRGGHPTPGTCLLPCHTPCQFISYLTKIEYES